jgi:hypothetical protein
MVKVERWEALTYLSEPSLSCWLLAVRYQDLDPAVAINENAIVSGTFLVPVTCGG